MQYHGLTGAGVFFLVASQLLAQGRPADTAQGQPIREPSHPSVQLDPILRGRQPGWVDESAITAGAALEAAKSPADVTDQASPSAAEIRVYVANLINAALSPDGMHKALGMLSDEDHVRLQKDISAEDIQAYQELVQRLRGQWKSRYDEDFDLARHGSVISEYYVLRGAQVNDPIAVGATINANQGRGAESAAKDPQAPSAAKATEERIATMLVPPNPQTQGSAMLLQFRKVPDGKISNWRLSTPQSLTGTRLQGNLTARIKKLLDGQDTWPTDPRVAYRLITYNVLASLADQPLDRPRQQPAKPQTPANPNNPSLES